MRTSRSDVIITKTKPKARSNPKKKKKLHTRVECLSLAQKLCKLRELKEYGRLWCISCGQTLMYGDTNTQGGHLISRQDRATETEPDNIWPQCFGCNVGKNGNVIAYRYNLVRLIGEERVKRIEFMSMARKGDEEALSMLSAEDRTKATMKKSAKYYDTLYQQLKTEIGQLESEFVYESPYSYNKEIKHD